jgi:hypothetical protein
MMPATISLLLVTRQKQMDCFRPDLSGGGLFTQVIIPWSSGVVGRRCLSFFLVSWCGVRLWPLGTSATNWPIAPAPDDRRWVWSSRWNENWQAKPKYSVTTCHSTSLSTTNPTWPDSSSNPGRLGGKPATNRLSYGTAYILNLIASYLSTDI